MQEYDKTSPLSIFEYSKKLIGKTLRDFGVDKEHAGKGGLGQLVETFVFHYPNNNNPGPDFVESGVELKCSPLKLSAKNKYLVKERLVCNIINYCKDYKSDFEHSHFYIKCKLMLILYYLHNYDRNVSSIDYKFIYAILWLLPEKDLIIIKQDYNIIIEKIRQGKAHELSEGDTMYLGACRKGEKGSDTTMQPFCDIPAPTRAFCLKTAYMRTILSYVEKYGGKAHACTNYRSTSKVFAKDKPLVSEEELQTHSFDDIILNRISQNYGQTSDDLAKKYGVDLSRNPKNKFSIIANAIVSNNTCMNVNRSEEFVKAGMQMKTIRLQRNGIIKEALAFENIDYNEVYNCSKWINSRLYELFTSRFLFVVFKQADNNLNEFVLTKAFFWTMPPEDIALAEKYWLDIRYHVCHNEIDAHYFWRISDDKKFHVRPKATNSMDLTDNPNGGKCKKFCYWFNNKYLRDIVNKNI